MCKRSSKWTTLDDLRPGAVFITEDGIKAVKSEYHYGNERDSQWQCILLASGEYAHFPDKNQTLVRHIYGGRSIIQNLLQKMMALVRFGDRIMNWLLFRGKQRPVERVLEETLEELQSQLAREDPTQR